MITISEIDIEKSKLKDRIYLKKHTFETTLLFIFQCFLTLSLPAITFSYTIENYKDFNNDIFG